jgi:zinc protease
MMRLVVALCLSLLALPVRAGLFDAQTFTLANGLRVVVMENPQSLLVGVYVAYGVGGADDPRGKSGLSHYLEHMMFKGKPGSSPARIMPMIDDIGGQIYANTTDDRTLYYEVVPSEHAQDVLRMEADRMANLDVVPEQAASELKVILEERNMRVGNRPMGQFYEALDATFYENHPYRLPIIGWRHEMETFTPQDVKLHHETFYAPNNAVLVITGNVTMAQVKAWMDKYFVPIPSRQVTERKRVQEPGFKATRSVTVTSDKIEHPIITLSFQAPHYTPADPHTCFALSVLADVLGGGDTSLLFKRLVEDQKIATDVDVGYRGFGVDPKDFVVLMSVAAGVTAQQARQSLSLAIQRLLKEGVTAQEVDHAKNRMLSSLLYLRDSQSRGAPSLAESLSMGIPLDTMENWTDHIRSVTVEQVNQALNKVLGARHCLVGYLLPEKAGQKGAEPVQPLNLSGGIQ